MPIITISRGSFAGGKALAEHLAERLSHPVLSREDILHQAAADYEISETELAQALNEAPPFWQQVPGKRLAYVKCVTAALLEHARHGKLIYHGNVGHLLLAGISHVLKVRVIADMEYRIQAAMRTGLTRDQAIAHIQRVDRERCRWAKLLYGVDWENPAQYHLIVNLGLMSLESASETIARLAELQEFEPTADSQKRLEDMSLSCRVWAAMARNPETRSAGVQVVADAGQVAISGSVRSIGAVEAVPKIAAAVEGVAAVKCDVGVGRDWYW